MNFRGVLLCRKKKPPLIVYNYVYLIMTCLQNRNDVYHFKGFCPDLLEFQ